MGRGDEATLARPDAVLVDDVNLDIETDVFELDQDIAGARRHVDRVGDALVTLRGDIQAMRARLDVRGGDRRGANVFAVDKNLRPGDVAINVQDAARVWRLDRRRRFGSRRWFGLRCQRSPRGTPRRIRRHRWSLGLRWLCRHRLGRRRFPDQRIRRFTRLGPRARQVEHDDRRREQQEEGRDDHKGATVHGRILIVLTATTDSRRIRNRKKPSVRQFIRNSISKNSGQTHLSVLGHDESDHESTKARRALEENQRVERRAREDAELVARQMRATSSAWE